MVSDFKKLCLLTVATIAFSADDGISAEAAAKKWQPALHLGGKYGNQRRIGQISLFSPVAQSLTDLIYLDLRFVADSRSAKEGNFGLGKRWFSENNQFILGFYGFYDFRHTELSNKVNQLTFGLEAMSETWDYRINAYLPENTVKEVEKSREVNTESRSTYFRGHTQFLVVDKTLTITKKREVALKGLDLEIGRSMPGFKALRLYGAYYHFQGRAGAPSINGFRARANLDLNKYVSFQLEGSHDKTRKSAGFIGVSFRIPLGEKDTKAPPLSDLDRRMTEQPMRDIDIVTSTKSSSHEVIEKREDVLKDDLVFVQDEAGLLFVGDSLREIKSDPVSRRKRKIPEGGAGSAPPMADGTYEHPYDFQYEKHRNDLEKSLLSKPADGEGVVLEERAEKSRPSVPELLRELKRFKSEATDADEKEKVARVSAEEDRVAAEKTSREATARAAAEAARAVEIEKDILVAEQAARVAAVKKAADERAEVARIAAEERAKREEAERVKEAARVEAARVAKEKEAAEARVAAEKVRLEEEARVATEAARVEAARVAAEKKAAEERAEADRKEVIRLAEVARQAEAIEKLKKVREGVQAVADAKAKLAVLKAEKQRREDQEAAFVAKQKEDRDAELASVAGNKVAKAQLAEVARVAAARIVAERVEKEKLEAEALALRIAAEQARVRLETEAREKEAARVAQLEKEKLERERKETEERLKREAEELALRVAAQEKAKREEAARVEAEQVRLAELARQVEEVRQQEEAARQKLEAEQKAAEEKKKEKIRQKNIKKKAARARKAEQEKIRVAQIEKEKFEAARIAEEAARVAAEKTVREEASRIAAEEAARQADAAKKLEVAGQLVKGWKGSKAIAAAKQELATLKEAKRLEGIRLAQEEAARQAEAATTIQSVFKGYKVRKEQALQGAAATTIQTAVRGHQARQELAELKAAEAENALRDQAHQAALAASERRDAEELTRGAYEDAMASSRKRDAEEQTRVALEDARDASQLRDVAEEARVLGVDRTEAEVRERMEQEALAAALASDNQRDALESNRVAAEAAEKEKVTSALRNKSEREKKKHASKSAPNTPEVKRKLVTVVEGMAQTDSQKKVKGIYKVRSSQLPNSAPFVGPEDRVRELTVVQNAHIADQGLNAIVNGGDTLPKSSVSQKPRTPKRGALSPAVSSSPVKSPRGTHLPASVHGVFANMNASDGQGDSPEVDQENNPPPVRQMQEPHRRKLVFGDPAETAVTALNKMEVDHTDTDKAVIAAAQNAKAREAIRLENEKKVAQEAAAARIVELANQQTEEAIKNKAADQARLAAAKKETEERTLKQAREEDARKQAELKLDETRQAAEREETLHRQQAAEQERIRLDRESKEREAELAELEDAVDSDSSDGAGSASSSHHQPIADDSHRAAAALQEAKKAAGSDDDSDSDHDDEDSGSDNDSEDDDIVVPRSPGATEQKGPPRVPTSSLQNVMAQQGLDQDRDQGVQISVVDDDEDIVVPHGSDGSDEQKVNSLPRVPTSFLENTLEQQTHNSINLAKQQEEKTEVRVPSQRKGFFGKVAGLIGFKQ
ncbi:inverse autotransporter beta domain-containing protein [Candidatus Finniella inopinata]|uniref:Uncharacterized protein n=1 Tax=Candidatus Finniella inopinata TaxID=1696036 RepID=A0A4Q7DHT8_9PROT|nr:inverse autotransporter beta domain-containing protein [Candidatus Finniella inopinata]RZI46272.1 hypothetical protein EQU50_04880 [Candidatus Finniella inopinata]